MKFEFILIGVIGLVIGLDYFFKVKNKNSSKEITSLGDSKNETLSKRIGVKWILISIGFIAVSSLVFYQFQFAPKKFKSSEVVFNDNLAYLRTDMSLLNGKIEDGRVKGLFVNGKREGYHIILYKYYYDDKKSIINRLDKYQISKKPRKINQMKNKH